jgi:hypothetical protein
MTSRRAHAASRREGWRSPEIARVISFSSTAQDGPGALFLDGCVSGYPHGHRGASATPSIMRSSRDRTCARVKDAVDATTPVDAPNAPTGVWKSRTEREIPTASTSIVFAFKKKKNEELQQDEPDHYTANRISRTDHEVSPMSPVCFVTHVGGRTNPDSHHGLLEQI